ncbi:MAG: hypothetical protein U0U69_06325 [Acidimicrobiia bacterium]
MNLARTLLRIEQVVHALRVTTEVVRSPGMRDRLDAWVGESTRRVGGSRLDQAARFVSRASDAAPAACGVLAVGTATRSSSPRPVVFATIAVGIPLAAPYVLERFGGPAIPAPLRRSIVDGASYGAFSRLGASGTAPAVAGAIATGTARVHLGGAATTVAAGTAAGWVWARLTATLFGAVGRRAHIPPPVEIEDYRERRSAQ